MKPFRLLPVQHESPTCASYDDETSVRQYERDVRTHRAHLEAYSITSLDGCVDGGYRVNGERGAPYHVDIVDSSGRHDSCSCPDFLTNELGVCKHIEAVRRGLRSSRRARGVYESLGNRPTRPTISIDAQGGLRVVALGRWSKRLRRAYGVPLEAALPAEIRPSPTLRAGELDDGVRVVHAVPIVRARMEAAAAIARRRRDVEAAFSTGRLSADVLSQPLFPYQREGLMHLVAAGRALLADDMGLGKTVQAIAACEMLRARGEASRIIVVTVASLKHQWAREIERFTGQKAVIVSGAPESRRRALLSDAPYKILNYEQTWRELEVLESLDADVMILDEAQRAKNFRTKTATTLRAIPSRFAFVLTGTPIENRLDDLYALMQIIEPTVLGPLWRFNLDFHSQNVRGRITGYKNLARLRERLSRFVLRRRKEEVLTQLPPLTHQTRYTPMSPSQRKLEEEYRTEAAKLLRIADKRPLTAQEQEWLMMALLKARQACNATRLCSPGHSEDGSAKLDELEALLHEITAQGSSKVIVFSEWVEMLKLASARLDALGIGYAMLHGGIPSDQRPQLLDRFRESADTRVLLSTDAGGVGLNLQVASYVIHLELPWNPGKLDQRTARAHRLGQTRGVSVTYLVSEEGIERGIESTLAGKRAVRSAALDPTSTVDVLEAPSFMLFLRQLRATMEALDQEPSPGGMDAMFEEAAATGSEVLDVGHVSRVDPSTAVAARKAAAPHRRLELARVVLGAGFPGDAVRAAYEGLAAIVAAKLEAPPPTSHAALVAALCDREVVASGRIPPTVHSALARLHDLTQLDPSAVEIDAALAEAAVSEAETWLSRLADPAVELRRHAS